MTERGERFQSVCLVVVERTVHILNELLSGEFKQRGVIPGILGEVRYQRRGEAEANRIV